MKAPIKSGLFFICICCLFIAETTFAGNITVRMQMTLTVLSDRISVRITTANLGTEPATDLQAFLHIFDQSLTSDIIPRLDVEQTRSFLFHLPVPAHKKGRFPFLGEVRYHDANHQPFSALSCDVFQLKHKISPDLTGQAPDLTLKRNGKLPVQISNAAARPLKATATLHLPYGLTTPIRQKHLELDPNSERKIEFQIIDPYETESAAYPVFCVLEYTENGIHQASIVRSTVRIKEFKNWFKKTKWGWLGGVVLIVLMWAGILLVKHDELDDDSQRT